MTTERYATPIVQLTPEVREFYLTQDERFIFWLDALEGARDQPVHDGEPMPGFYRARSRNKDTGMVTFYPVAYWFEGSEIKCLYNGRPVPDLKAAEMWQWVSNAPISHEVYQRRLETGLWPEDPMPLPADHPDAPAETIADPLERLKARIATLVAQGKALTDITLKTEQGQAQAQTVRASLLGCKSAGETDLERENKPYEDAYKAYRANMGRWNPVIKDADDQAKIVRVRMERGLTAMRLEAQRAQEELQRTAQEAANAAQAAAPGDNAPAPAVVPVLELPTAPTQIRGSTGRAASARETWQLDNDAPIDYDLVYQHFKTTQKVKDLLRQMAATAIRDGFVVPGTTRKEGTSIR